MRFRVLIVDEHPIVRLGVCALLDCEDDLLVVGEAGDAETALYLAETLEPYLVVSDLWLSDEMSGVCFCKDLKAMPRSAKVLFYTARNSHEDTYSCYLAGADGFVHKGEDTSRFVDARRQVCAGKRVWLLGGTPKKVNSKPVPAAGGTHLTPREREILALLLEGYSNGRIAETLCVGITTVKTHVAHVFRKLGVSSREELFMFGGRMS